MNTGGEDKKSVAEEKKVREVDDIDDEDDDDDEAVIDEDQERIDGLNLLGQLFHVLALQYQKVFGRGNNLKALETNSTAVKFDGEDQDDDEEDDGIFELGDYDYDLEPRGQIERPEVQDDGEVVKKKKRKTEEKNNKDKVINKNLLRRKFNGTSTSSD